MQQARGVKKGLLRFGTQAVVFAVIGMLVFSPFTQFFKTPLAQARDCPTGTDSYARSTGGSEWICYDKSDTVLERIPDADYSGTRPSAEEGTGGAGDILNSLFNVLSQVIYNFTVAVGGFFASVGAAFLNLAVHLSLSSTAYGMQFVTDGWTTARDLANMFFILILIYVAVTIMLSADTGKTMNMLVRVLLIALVINFSFFITRVVIDAGNFTATQFYNNIPAGTTNPVPGVAAVQVTKDLSTSIMGAVGAEQLLGNEAFKNFSKQIGGAGEFVTILVICLFMGAVYAILAAVFVATGIKFVVRIAVLWLTIVASPLALVAYTVPTFEPWFKRWRDNLISHSFFPVAFLFIFWLITKFAGDLKLSDAFKSFDPGSGTVLSGLASIGSLMADVGLRLGFLVAMLMLGLKIADELGTMGAEAANGLGNKFAFGGLGFAGRNTVGRAGLALTRNETVRDWASKSAVGAGVLRGAGLLSRGSFDLRSLPGAGKLKGQLGEAGGEGGMAKQAEKYNKKRQEAVEALGNAIKGDIRDEEKSQERYEEGYARKHNGVTYSAAVKALQEEIDAKKDAIKTHDRTAAEGATEDERSTANKNAKLEKARLQLMQNKLKGMVEHGKHEVEHTAHERSGVLAKRLSNRFFRASRGTLKGIAHLTHHESNEQKLAKAAKAIYEDEHGGGEHEEQAPHVQPQQPPQAPPHAPPPAAGGGGGADHGGGHDPHH